jgi:hypothetical protein
LIAQDPAKHYAIAVAAINEFLEAGERMLANPEKSGLDRNPEMRENILLLVNILKDRKEALSCI